MAPRLAILVVFVAFALHSCCAINASTLVLVDGLAIKETHSAFFAGLKARGHSLTFKLADDANLALSKYGEYLYENLILFAPSAVEFGGAIGVDSIAKFVDDGGNVLAAADASAGDALRELASEFGFELDEDGSAIVDHLNADGSDDGRHTKIVAEPKSLVDAAIIVGDRSKLNPILYEGAGLVADPDNPLVLPILSAESTAYGCDPDSPVREYPHAIGKRALLLAGLQARNNARVVFSGSLYFFSDEAFESPVKRSRVYPKSGNEQLATAVGSWAFGERGRLRVKSVTHRKAGETSPPSSYTVGDSVVYRTEIEELVDGRWTPYRADDLQLEFVRIDPFVRTTLKRAADGAYEARFAIPDVYGVYRFKVDYDRIGYARLSSVVQVSVRPLEHTQYERFVPCAYPYYASSFSMMFGVLIFSFVFLHYGDKSVKTKSE